MKKSLFSKQSETDRDFLQNAKDEEIDLSDTPEITEEQIARAVMRVGRKPIPEGDDDRLRRIIARTLALIRERYEAW